MNNNAIQRKLLLETDFTLDKAVTLAISINQTDEGAKALEPGQVHSMSNKFKPNSSKQIHHRYGNGQAYQHKPAQAQQVPCHRCGGPHSPHRLRALHATSVQNKDIKACLSKKHSATTTVKYVHSIHFVGSAHHQILKLNRMLMIQIFTCLLCQVVQILLLSMLKFLLTLL